MCLFAGYIRLIVIFGHFSVYEATNVVDKVVKWTNQHRVTHKE